MSRLTHFISERVGWNLCLKPFMHKRLPRDLSWSATLGSLCVLVFAVQAVTGMFLAMYYNPSPQLAYESINYIMNEVSLGRILRGVHHWGASAMVVLVIAHMMSNFFSGSFKAPRELTWVVGVILFLITLGLGFTGYLLPWDEKAYWATVVSSNIPRAIPVIGDFITRVMLGGDRVSGLTLTRFFSVHMVILPGLLGLFAVLHIYLVRVHGMAERGSSILSGRTPVEPGEDHIYRFYPEHLFRASIAFAVVFCVILLLAVFGRVPLEDKVGVVDDTYLPRPEWYFMWLFQLLTFFSGSTEVVGTLAVPVVGVLVLFLMPWLSRTDLRGLADRPLATAAGMACILGLVYLTFMGFAAAGPYGKIIPLPDRQLNPSEVLGLKVFVSRECAYCHNINGKGGRVEGPDLSNMIIKDRMHDRIMKSVRDPQSVSRWSIMPRYDLNEEDLKGLADFILALDFSAHEMKIIGRQEVLGDQQDKMEPSRTMVREPEDLRSRPGITTTEKEETK